MNLEGVMSDGGYWDVLDQSDNLQSFDLVPLAHFGMIRWLITNHNESDWFVENT
jgi:hypothetical protein